MNEEGQIVLLPELNTTDETQSLHNIYFSGRVIPSMSVEPVIQDYKIDDGDATPNALINNRYDYNFHKTIDASIAAGDAQESPVYAMPTAEESEVYARTYDTIKTYVKEVYVDLTYGNKTIDDLPEIQKQLEEMGINELMESLQARRDRVLGK